MAYLIIPAVCFVVLAGLSWLCIDALYDPKVGKIKPRVWTGKIDDLDRIFASSMSAKSGTPFLTIKVSGHVPLLKLTFPGSAVWLEIPVLTDLQQHRRDSDLEILRGLKLNARISKHNRDHDTLVCEVDGPSSSASLVVKDIFARLFDADPTKLLEYQVSEQISDQNVAGKPTAAAQERQPKTVKQGRIGCMGMLASLFILPIPFVIAYLKFGYIAASGTLVAIFIFREIFNRWINRRRSFFVGDALKIFILILTGTTIYVGDPLYLQLIPTVCLLAAGGAHLLAITFKLPWLSLADPSKFNDPLGWKMMSLMLITTCLAGAATNEYLRTILTLDDWIWYFAFVRIELIFSFLIAAVPYGFYWARLSKQADSGNSSKS